MLHDCGTVNRRELLLASAGLATCAAIGTSAPAEPAISQWFSVKFQGNMDARLWVGVSEATREAGIARLIRDDFLWKDPSVRYEGPMNYDISGINRGFVGHVVSEKSLLDGWKLKKVYK